jgi:hypothetical protein
MNGAAIKASKTPPNSGTASHGLSILTRLGARPAGDHNLWRAELAAAQPTEEDRQNGAAPKYGQLESTAPQRPTGNLQKLLAGWLVPSRE